jgi:hypothetical protein
MEILPTSLKPSQKDTLKGVAAGATALGLACLAEYLSEKAKVTPIWEYQSDPELPLQWDKYTRIVTNPLMKLFAGGIVSHHWDWIRIPEREDYSHRWVKSQGDSFYQRFEGKKLTPFHHALAHVASGVQEVYILGLDQDKVGKEIKEYYYAFQVAGQEEVSKSRIVIPSNEQVRILVSTYPTRVLALDKDHNELPSIALGPFKRNDPKVKHLRQF